MKVAVIGAGIGGLAAVAALRRRGIEAEVVEQARALGEIGAGISLASNGWRLLERLGLLAQIEQVGSHLDQGYFQLREDGSFISTLREPGAAWDRRVFGVHRADLIEVLASALPDSAIHTGHRLLDLEQDDSGVRLRFENGETARADVVIGADGIHSVVRRHVVGEVAAPRSSGTAAYRALVPVTGAEDWEWGTSKMWIGPGKHFLVYPIRADRLINIVAVVPAHGGERDSWTAPGDPAQLAAEFTGWDPVVTGLIERVTDTFQWGLFDRPPLASWTSGRLALLGDAAHAMLPHLGQGGSQTIEDAFALAAALEGSSVADAPEALAQYQSLRLERANAVQLASLEAGHLYDSVVEEEYDARDERIRKMAPFYGWLASHDADSLVAPPLAPSR
ncbi:putative salicylate hydroxylase [Citricoccus zhacaiensis]|uniref:Salicylate hydroxylase n=1 Tax=Citricoccus zhacaiensis TaxID=489142 RepID=A0ABQ2M5R0_9MICC|nr:FAD-dependent monooxygenase [Citricoccus zhacaiensis]GGO47221.1 putative salicylate hydroxylase [Citricoccus zhacaiensis]